MKEFAMVNLYNDDCLNVFKTINDNSIDLIVSDIPYKIVSGGCIKDPAKIRATKFVGDMLDRRNPAGHDLIKSGKIFKYNDIKFSEFLPSLYRILKDDSHCYLMVNGRNLNELQNEAEKVGFKYQNLLVWDKGNATPNKWYMNACEFILFLRKGKAKNINNLGSKTILSVPNVRNKMHPTEKPIELMQILIENSSNENDTVLDPFMGCGSTGIACLNTNRNFVGIELDKSYFEIAQNRINKLRELNW